MYYTWWLAMTAHWNAVCLNRRQATPIIAMACDLCSRVFQLVCEWTHEICSVCACARVDGGAFVWATCACHYCTIVKHTHRCGTTVLTLKLHTSATCPCCITFNHATLQTSNLSSHRLANLHSKKLHVFHLRQQKRCEIHIMFKWRSKRVPVCYSDDFRWGRSMLHKHKLPNINSWLAYTLTTL